VPEPTSFEELRAQQQAALAWQRKFDEWKARMVNSIELRKFCVEHSREGLSPADIYSFLTEPLRDSPTDTMSQK